MALVYSTVSSCLSCEDEGSLNCIAHFVCEMILEEIVMNTKVVDGCVLRVALNDVVLLLQESDRSRVAGRVAGSALHVQMN
jgi:hypothetical protein